MPGGAAATWTAGTLWPGVSIGRPGVPQAAKKATNSQAVRFIPTGKRCFNIAQKNKNIGYEKQGTAYSSKT
jgi:gentisate 1,2-dioxygenase